MIWNSKRRRRRKLHDKLSQSGDALFIILRAVVSDARNLIMRASAAKRFAVNGLSDSAFDKVRPSKPHKRGAFDHDDDIGESGQVSAARDARPHDGGELRNL